MTGEWPPWSLYIVLVCVYVLCVMQAAPLLSVADRETAEKLKGEGENFA